MLRPVTATFSQAAPLHAGSTPTKTTDMPQFLETMLELGRQMKAWPQIRRPCCTDVFRYGFIGLKKKKERKDRGEFSVKDVGICYGMGRGRHRGRERIESRNRQKQKMEASLDNNKTFQWKKESREHRGGKWHTSTVSDGEGKLT